MPLKTDEPRYGDVYAINWQTWNLMMPDEETIVMVVGAAGVGHRVMTLLPPPAGWTPKLDERGKLWVGVVYLSKPEWRKVE